MAVRVSELVLGDPRLAVAWPDLQARAPVPSPFLTYQWGQALGAVSAVSSAVRVLVVADGGRELGLLPVERWTHDGVRVLGPAGARWLAPDHVDVLAAPADRDLVAAAVAAHLVARPSWDLLDLEGLAAGGALLTALGRLHRPWLLRLPAQLVPVPYVSLHDRAPGPLLAGRNLRQQVARGLRSCERSGGGLRVATSPDEIRRLLPVLMRLHQERFGSRSQVFATPARREFHLQAAARLAEQEMARVYWLEAGGQEAALLYALRVRDRLYYYSMGMRPDLALSPGRTLLGQTLLAADAEGLAEFDLLRGDHDFKLRFATGTRADVRLRLLRLTSRSLRWGVRQLARRHRRRLAGRP